MSWASRRQATYLLGFIIILAAAVGVPLFFVLHTEPTCTDGIKNGTEEGIDCGGTCPIVCSFQAVAPIVHWSRLFEVVPGLYTVVALVENPNTNFQALNVPYSFKLRDRGNILVQEEKGVIMLPPRRQVPIFITGIKTGERIPVRVDFEWLQPPTWADGQELPNPLVITDRQSQSASTTPRISARISNEDVNTITDLPVVVIVYDSDGNALHASRTVVEALSSKEKAPLIFTWRQPFDRPVSRIEIIPLLHEAQIER